jgi:serine/threonine protein kinase
MLQFGIGRMNRGIDFRTDYYSLGITFYELLNGQTPFSDSLDSMEVIYSHIARSPSPLYETNSNIPKFLSGSNLQLEIVNIIQI